MSREHDARWADGLLAEARSRVEPRPEDATRNFASIEARLALGLEAAPAVVEECSGVTRVPASTPAPAPPAPSPAARWSMLTKASLVLGFGLATGVVGYWLGRTETAGRVAPADESAALVRSGAVPDAVPVPDAVQPPPASVPAGPGVAASDVEAAPAPASPVSTPPLAAARPRRAPPRAAPPVRARAVTHAASARTEGTPEFGLREALELLRHAEAALRRGDGLEARMWLGDLDRRAPPGLLLEERLVSKTLAECALGDAAAADQTLSQLERSNTESIYRARLENSCVAARIRAP